MNSEFDGYEIELPIAADHHNATDFDQFKDFQKNLLERFEDGSKAQRRETLKRRLRMWDMNTEGRWHRATLGKFEDRSTAERVQYLMKSDDSAQSFYIHSLDPYQGTYLAYAIVRRYIGHGKMTPSRIVRISEDELLGYATAGFAGKDAIAKLLQKQNTVYVMDNCGSRDEYNERFELPVIEQFISHVYSQDKQLLMISQVPLAEYKKLLSVSSQSRLDMLFDKTVVNLDAQHLPYPSEETGHGGGIDQSTLGLFEG